MNIKELPFTIDAIAKAYAEGVRPEAVIAEAFRRLEAVGDPGIFIHEARETALAEAAALGKPDGRPLWGVPYVAKDNIDVAGMPTTAACPDFEYRPADDAFVVSKLRAAGAICLGKTNLDQFATGLVGVRTPYPVPRNALDPEIVPGGSSAGSAVAVAQGMAAFSLGTDTAGSGRVPAALNSIVGLKPTLGALSSSGVVPACRTLDTISIFAMTVADAWTVFDAACSFDAKDAYSRDISVSDLSAVPPALRIGVPDTKSLIAFDNGMQETDFRGTVAKLASSGATIVELDFEPFYAVARMLYEGAWLAERVSAVGDRLTEKPETLHPTTRAILEPGLALSAVDAFEGQYRLKELERACLNLLAKVDALCVPTIPSFVSVKEIEADPIGPNSLLGTYTNFVNLLDMCGIAIPTGTRADGRPGSVTLLGEKGRDALCAAVALTLEAGSMGATVWERPTHTAIEPGAPRDSEIAIAVCGAHMSGLPLNHQLTDLGGRFLRAAHSAPEYGLYALAGGPPARPGMVRQAKGGGSIALEVWALPKSGVGAFLAGIPAPLGLGTVTLDDGSAVKGFICEAHGIAEAKDITAFCGWRAWLAAGQKTAAQEAVA
ncbi:allophanate hydrolase [Nitratireductor mangrovi]|uniref:Allophanate hydrolase n=1 Tax=Nitratireductor mangrovi TaxID=2599600 RepID=A0A5B8L2Y1_9HYPH|nr:allophanate hydrolase [Nitratireductor mangrovi]QDZ02296.1 allophanate hydrolase [Nitratireductor mangrovi]